MNWLNYHHLRYFWVVAREGSLSAAAARLNVSQPSISGQIRELEEALGERLFRREGRRNVLTDVGQAVLGYADEIFLLGDELLSNVKRQGPGRVMRLHVGVVDSFPKLVTNQILDPVFNMRRAIHVICREGKIEDLLAQLAMHRLDVVLADEVGAGTQTTRTFSHRLGWSALAVCAARPLAKTLKRGFPRSLNDAPALLPAASTSSRRALEKWFLSAGVRPRLLAEFEDLALMKAMAADGKGFTVLPTVALAEAGTHYGFEAVGRAGRSRIEYFAITAERRIQHPAVLEITQRAHDALRA